MKPAGKRIKGKRLEIKVAQMIREAGLDDKCTRMPLSGSCWNMRTDIHSTIPYSIECKNTERHNLWSEWQQAVNQATTQKPPILVISANHRPILAILKLEDLLNILLSNQQLEGKQDGRLLQKESQPK